MSNYTCDKYMLFKNDTDRERAEKILQTYCPNLFFFLINTENSSFEVVKIRSGNWIIDLEKKVAFYKNEQFDLSKKEFQILEFLFEDLGNEYTIEEISYALNMGDKHLLVQIIDNLIERMKMKERSVIQKKNEKYFIDV